MQLSMRKKVLAGAVAATALVGLAAGPSFAATGNTTTSFSLSAGTLSVSVPASASLSAVSESLLGGTATGSLGSTSVTDTRGGLSLAWTATVSSSDFTTGAASADETVTKANVGYTPGNVTSSGNATIPAVGTAAPSLATGVAVVAATNVIGSVSASWNPTIAVTVPSTKVAGTYSGTITHSVA